MIRIEEGKDAKDTMLSPQLLTILCGGYWRLVRSRHWLLPLLGGDETRPIDPQALHAACGFACTASGPGLNCGEEGLASPLRRGSSCSVVDEAAVYDPFRPSPSSKDPPPSDNSQKQRALARHEP